jgi:hypothetical protein
LAMNYNNSLSLWSFDESDPVHNPRAVLALDAATGAAVRAHELPSWNVIGGVSICVKLLRIVFGRARSKSPGSSSRTLEG